jgi:CheY-like chemotaxis protein
LWGFIFFVVEAWGGGDVFDVLLIDLHMPLMGGMEVRRYEQYTGLWECTPNSIASKAHHHSAAITFSTAATATAAAASAAAGAAVCVVLQAALPAQQERAGGSHSGRFRRYARQVGFKFIGSRAIVFRV